LTEITGRGPKYQRIADVLRAAIVSGEWPPGQKVPPETALLDRFGVSLPTLRQAIGVLRAEGLLVSRHGVGTFVKEDRRLERRSRGRYRRAGQDETLPTSSVGETVFAGRDTVRGRIAAALALPDNAEVIVRRRLLRDRSTGRLEEIGASFIPIEIAGATYLERTDGVPKPLFLCVQELSGRRYAFARDEWIARPATVEEADRFDLPAGAPVAHLIHRATAEDGSVLEVSESVWPADRIVIIDEYEIPPSTARPSTPSDD
jgi:GntR family transcriptional regulator